MKNIPEFIALIKRYESITLEEIEQYGKKFCGETIAAKLTGFGAIATCTLCKSAYEDCSACVYKLNHGCHRGSTLKSYFRICDSSTSKQLLAAFRNRAKVLRQYAVSIGINIE